MTSSTRVLTAVSVLAGCLLAVGACQKVEQKSPQLTRAQAKKVKKHTLDEPPEPDYEIGANYGGQIELVGFDVEEPIVPGQEATFVWYWKALKDLDKDWKIFVHFDAQSEDVGSSNRRQNLDHQPLDGLFPTSEWPKGKVIKDVQKITIRSDYPVGPAIPHIGLYRSQRLPIENAGESDFEVTEDRRLIGPKLQVGGEKSGNNQEAPSNEPPSYAVHMRDSETAENIEIDGRLDEDVWQTLPSLELTPFGGGSGFETTARTLVAGRYLVVGARLEDDHVWSTLEDRDSKTWTQECFELFVDVDGDGSNYLEFQINPMGAVFDANFKERLGRGAGTRTEQINRAKQFNLEGLESSVHVEGTVNDESDEDDYWSVEVKIPLESIPGVDAEEPKATDVWAVNMYRYDRPDEESTHTFAWNTATRGDFHQVDKFGHFRFAVDPEDIKEAVGRGKGLRTGEESGSGESGSE